MNFYKSPLHKRPVFYVDNRVFITDGKTYCADDIISIEINCILGRLFPARKNLDMIEELIYHPPLFKLYGSIYIKTLYGEIKIPRVYRVMEAYLHFKRIYEGTRAYYIYGRKRLEYEYKSIFEKGYFENRRYFSSLYILNEKDRLDRSKIMEESRKWAEECGYRLCRPEESSTFCDYVLTKDDDRWISIYSDAIEDCTANGLMSQCKINSEQRENRPVIAIEVYDRRIVLIGCGVGDDVKLYYCGDEEMFETLRCEKSMFSDDYSAVEKLSVSDRKSFKDILENTTVEGCLKDLAEKFAINDYFIRDGFYGLAGMNRYEVREFANGYHIAEERIRPDENDKSADMPFENIYQGLPAFDILKADEKLVSGRKYSITGMNIGRSGDGFAFCIRSFELHDVITMGLKTGRVPVRLYDCSYTIGGSTVKFECEYKLFRGEYAFLFEGFDAELPDGVVIHPANIKTSEDKKTAEDAQNAASVTVNFTFESDVPLMEELEIEFIPMRNFSTGIGLYKTKLINEV